MILTLTKKQGQGQLLQRGRATVAVDETLKYSWEVTETGSIWKLGYGFLFALRSNYSRIFGSFDTIHKRDRHPATARQQEPRYAVSLGCSARQ